MKIQSLPSTAAGSLLILLLAPIPVQSQRGPEGDGMRRPAPIPLTRSRDQRDSQRGDRGGGFTADFPIEFRSYDGTGNGVQSDHGAAGREQIRLSLPAYEDGAHAPSGSDRPSPRAVSNAVLHQAESIPAANGASDYVWQWGQFLDHDIVETPAVDPVEPFDIAVPAGDPWFDPTGSGSVVLPFNRSFYHIVEGVREQVNEITSFIDASQVYGSSARRAEALRTLDGTGRLKTSEGNLLPFNTDGLPNAPASTLPQFFVAGDVRVNEQIGLTAMHTLFLREHNFWADVLRHANPEMSDEELYQSARCIVAAEMQAITYREFLPILLGRDALPPYRGYRPEVTADISTEFSTVGFRIGHSMVSSNVLRIDANLEIIPNGNLSLAQAFFNLDPLFEDGIDPVLRGLAFQQAEEVDSHIVDDLRNFLFGPPGSGGLDLGSLNIQRGRDHGIGSYTDLRRAYGLPRVQRFSDINRDPTVFGKLASVYASPRQIDPWVGAMAEEHVRGAMVGPTMRAIMVEQFRRLRDGDRFWYESYLSPALVNLVQQQTLAVILRRNTGLGEELPDHLWQVAGAAPSGPSPRPRREGR